jgi:glycerophosphoryl diester phosphodiesterase
LRAGVRHLGADFVAAHRNYIGLGALQEVVDDGLPIWVWTVNERGALERCLREKGVEAVITDKVELALGLRDGKSSRAP